MGKLIVIEGVDGTGKQTQVRRLTAWFRAKRNKVREISFPDYESPACMPVKMYLSEDFGTTPGSVSPYQAAPLYTIDRFASFAMDWEKDYLDPDCIVLADRYVGSNAYHQGKKCKNEKELNKFLDWLYDFEFNKYQLPVPDQTFWLDLDPEKSQKWIAK